MKIYVRRQNRVPWATAWSAALGHSTNDKWRAQSQFHVVDDSQGSQARSALSRYLFRSA